MDWHDDRFRAFGRIAPVALLAAACGGGTGGSGAAAIPDRPRPDLVEGTCSLAAGAEAPASLRQIPCAADFEALASEPIDASLPGARSVKVVLDQALSRTGTGADALYFQDSVRYRVHYDFASRHLSGNGLPVVPSLAEFNSTEYFSPERRFVLGAVTHYEGPGEWTLELAPYDTAPAELIAVLFRAVQAATFFGPALAFHPTSEALRTESARLPGDVPVVTTDALYAGIDYQPLSLGTAVGRLRFALAAQLDTLYLSHDEIVVLDEAPNDIDVVRGLVTAEFQTPLSHVNVLSRNRGTPNMGLRGAMADTRLRAHEGALVELTVGASAWSIRAATREQADAFTATHAPPPVTLPPLDLAVTSLVDVREVTREPGAGESPRDALKEAARAFGGKAAHYSVLARTEGLPVLEAFAVPVFHYDQFMRENGFYARVAALVAGDTFRTDARVRDEALADLRRDMQQAPVDAAFQELLWEKLAAGWSGAKVRFRTSTNSEDLDGFPCAGCYESHTGDPADRDDVLDAVRETWASAWLFRTFDERTFYGVAHESVGMALLVHRNFPDEEANGVAVTANPFDTTGLQPAFYVNVQKGGDAEVVHPPPGVKSDELLYFFHSPNQPVMYLTHSSLVPAGQTVLTPTQLHALGVALEAIHQRFSDAYGPAAGNTGWYAMDVEFKFDDDDAPAEPPALYVKQARPYPSPRAAD
jgi:hypothetical protein